MSRIPVITVMQTTRSLTVLQILLLLGSSAAWTGCSGPATPSGSETYTLTGSVRSGTSLERLGGATVAATGAGSSAVTTTVTADLNGEFTIGGLNGYITLYVTEPGFYPETVGVTVDRDRRADVFMITAAPLLPEGADLALGQAVHSSLGPSDPRCDPQWDRNAPCRKFGLTVDVPGTYQFSFRQSGRCGELELHVIVEDGTRVGWAAGKNTWAYDAKLEAKRRYEIRLMAYYECEWFELTVK